MSSHLRRAKAERERSRTQSIITDKYDELLDFAEKKIQALTKANGDMISTVKAEGQDNRSSYNFLLPRVKILMATLGTKIFTSWYISLANITSSWKWKVVRVLLISCCQQYNRWIQKALLEGGQRYRLRSCWHLKKILVEITYIFEKADSDSSNIHSMLTWRKYIMNVIDFLFRGFSSRAGNLIRECEVYCVSERVSVSSVHRRLATAKLQ